MNREEADAIISTIRGFVDKGQAAQRAVDLTLADKKGTLQAGEKLKGAAAAVAEVNGAVGSMSADQIERLYQMFKARFIDEAKIDPVLLRLIMVQPEILVEIERNVITLDGTTLKGRVARLIAAGWFKDPRATSAVRQELKRTGADPGGGGTLSDQLAGLQRAGFLAREGEGWQAVPGIKVTESDISK